jgi:hypothetical protein
VKEGRFKQTEQRGPFFPSPIVDSLPIESWHILQSRAVTVPYREPIACQHHRSDLVAVLHVLVALEQDLLSRPVGSAVRSLKLLLAGVVQRVVYGNNALQKASKAFTNVPFSIVQLSPKLPSNFCNQQFVGLQNAGPWTSLPQKKAPQSDALRSNTVYPSAEQGTSLCRANTRGPAAQPCACYSQTQNCDFLYNHLSTSITKQSTGSMRFPAKPRCLI